MDRFTGRAVRRREVFGGRRAQLGVMDYPIDRAAVRAVATADLDLVGLAVYGPKNAVDKVLKGARMHP